MNDDAFCQLPTIAPCIIGYIQVKDRGYDNPRFIVKGRAHMKRNTGFSLENCFQFFSPVVSIVAHMICSTGSGGFE